MAKNIIIRKEARILGVIYCVLRTQSSIPPPPNTLFGRGILDVLMNEAIKEITASQDIVAIATETIKYAFVNDDFCLLCKHFQPCEKEKCDCYEKGRGLMDASGKKLDWTWTCEDFDFGTCKKLENTPCNGCTGLEHWEWNKKKKDNV